MHCDSKNCEGEALTNTIEIESETLTNTIEIESETLTIESESETLTPHLTETKERTSCNTIFTSGLESTAPRTSTVLLPTKLWNWTLSWTINQFSTERLD